MAPKRPRSPTPPPASDDLDTDTKLALLASLHPKTPLDILLRTLLSTHGSVDAASTALHRAPPTQTSITPFLHPTPASHPPAPPRPPKKGSSLHLYTPAQLRAHSLPCTLLPHFLPLSLATTLLTELLHESRSFPPPARFHLFNRAAVSPHTSGFFRRRDARAFVYQARSVTPRAFTASMEAATALVEAAVRREQGVRAWTCDTALVNRYEGVRQGVGWHADALTNIGPRAVIASVSLGAQREFRVRRVDAEEEGQYVLHLPHNSLLVMHAGMQEEWKHCVPQVRSLVPHPVAGETRINVTYRWYRLGVEAAPVCRCGLRTVLRAMRRGGYAWMCGGGYVGAGEGGEGCGFWREYVEGEVYPEKGESGHSDDKQAKKEEGTSDEAGDQRSKYWQ